ncbi:MAPEG family protein [Marinobacter sp. BW6]|uniref:MAPEG family protein n=1 Tax=Marinobacter sp. BW6 TaxID=2592624 RepID=UPI0011DEA7DC|nr:MAPEG family protein [Marinobacter sp. BW6]TYC55394.1 MAPEG family protein [Marinobacter sp. BW6]
MSSPTIITLVGFIAWSMFLLVLMESIRSKMVLAGEVAPNGFNPENSNLSPFMQRLTRAYANCIEGLPIFGGLMAAAVVTSNAHVTDQLAYVFLGARLVQSLIHLASLSPVAVTMRFSAFAVQMGIGVYWCYKLLAVLVS